MSEATLIASTPLFRVRVTTPVVAKASPISPGRYSNQIPTGRSKRPSFSQGRSGAGAKRSTQFCFEASGRGAEVEEGMQG